MNHLIHPPCLFWDSSCTRTSLSKCVPVFLWHQAKGRWWFGAGGAGPVGKRGGKKAQEQTCACTERGRRLAWWMLWHHHCSETFVVLPLYTYRVRAQLHCQHKPSWWHYTGMAVHMKGARMSPQPLLWSIQWTPLPRRDDMPICFSFLLGMTHCSYLVISRNIQGWVGRYAGADNTTQNTELPPG